MEKKHSRNSENPVLREEQRSCYNDAGKITGRQGSENAGNLFVAEYRENMYDRRESLNFL